ncbi:hypothetical protein FKM82_013474 [Ascaphus truei]
MHLTSVSCYILYCQGPITPRDLGNADVSLIADLSYFNEDNTLLLRWESRLGIPKFLVDVLLKAVGDTPIMKNKKWTMEKARTIQGLMDFIKKYLKMESAEQLFVYVNQSFAPSPDQEVGTLYECFGSDGKLVLHYCKSQAWG